MHDIFNLAYDFQANQETALNLYQLWQKYRIFENRKVHVSDWRQVTDDLELSDRENRMNSCHAMPLENFLLKRIDLFSHFY